MKKQVDLHWRLVFKGSDEPFIVPKTKATTVASLTRGGSELIGQMAGWCYIYYVKTLPHPIEKVHMVASLTMTKLEMSFKESLTPPDDDKKQPMSVWIFYRCGQTDAVKAIHLKDKNTRTQL